MEIENNTRSTMSQKETNLKMIDFENQNLKKQLQEMQVAVSTY